MRPLTESGAKVKIKYPTALYFKSIFSCFPSPEFQSFISSCPHSVFTQIGQHCHKLTCQKSVSFLSSTPHVASHSFLTNLEISLPLPVLQLPLISISHQSEKTFIHLCLAHYICFLINLPASISPHYIAGHQ